MLSERPGVRRDDPPLGEDIDPTGGETDPTGERIPGGGSEQRGPGDMTDRHRTDGRDGLGRLLEVAGQDARGADERRRLDPRVAAAVVDAGFARHFVPAKWGGTAGSFARLLADASAVAEACAATGWCAALYAAHGRLAAYLPERGQREVWAHGPDVRIAASVVPPQGNATPVPGGWRLDGEWRTASGVDHAEWVLLASWTPGLDGTREHRLFAVPRAELSVRDTWDSVGLRGSGSNSVTGEGITVPAHRSFTLGALLRPLPDAARCHRVPYPMVAAPIFAAAVLGAARAALRAWTAECVRPEARRPGQDLLLASASARVHAAGLLLEGTAVRADRGEITPLTVAENRRDAATAAAWCREAANDLFHASGMRGQSPHSRVQRAWRDVTTAASHGALGLDAAADAYADAALAGGDTR
ncbi:oxidoreductase [Streptomyces cyanogenus]|uniref:Flavin-dependent monooxygenase, oxygenase subunit HsaA n=1 Tax=Streptomyces cyanogenus TaxID=80860 RepID=A0ABX7TYJ2_STRCY|nr:oxidoreductase [Streptomyces cyanogenus]QTE01860.1 Flavin-dependent monooxygenase, oxygenase subunit HsaA [Streptomyces cyanogenus]